MPTTKHATTNASAVQPKQHAVQPYNIATDAACYHANVTIACPTSEISRTLAGMSQHLGYAYRSSITAIMIVSGGYS